MCFFPKEYSSKPAILGMANRLSVTDKEAMTEPKIQESNQDLFNGDTGLENVITTLLQEDPNFDTLIAEMENEDWKPLCWDPIGYPAEWLQCPAGMC